MKSKNLIKYSVCFVVLFVVLLSSCAGTANSTATVEHAREWLTGLEETKVTINSKEYTVELSDDFLALLKLEQWENKTGSRSQKVVATIYLYEQCEIYLHGNGTASIYYGYAPRNERAYNLFAIPSDVAEAITDYVVNND